MRAIRCEAFGPPGEVVLRNLPDPVARPGEVVVRVEGAALNFPDVLLVQNKYQLTMTLPYTPGSEFAGTVLSLGADVTAFRVGDRVMGSGISGAFAEQVAVPATRLRPVPAGLDSLSAAAFQVTFRTGYHALTTIGGLQSGRWVVVLGAAGGVGSACVDIASRLGARVIAAGSRPDSLDSCRELGAEAVIDYGTEDLKARIKEITGDGADLVIDPVGGAYSEQALRATAWGGRFVVIGFASGDIPRIPLNLVLLKGVILRGFEIRTLPHLLPDAYAEGEKKLAGLVAQGLRPKISAVYPLERTGEALTAMAERRISGKVVIAPQSGT